MSFLEKYELLKKSIPVPAVILDKSEQAEYCDVCYGCKNCYFCFDCFKLENGIYSVVGWGKELVDCYLCYECELCYACTICNKCYGSTFLLDCINCRECHFSAMCASCSDCFGCVGLTHKQYCIFNKQYSKDEYFQRVAELKKENPEKIFNQMLELKKRIPYQASQQLNNVNSPYGDYIYRSKDCYWCFNITDCDSCGYIFEGNVIKNSWDIYWSGGSEYGMELCYEMNSCASGYGSAFLLRCDNCRNCFYSSYLRNRTDCFGCVELTNKKYCILNNQLTKEQYEKAVKEIKRELGWRY